MTQRVPVKRSAAWIAMPMAPSHQMPYAAATPRIISEIQNSASANLSSTPERILR